MGIALEDPDAAEDVLSATIGDPGGESADPEPQTPDTPPEPVEAAPVDPDPPAEPVDDVVGELVVRPREELQEVSVIPGRDEFLSLAAQAKVYAGSNLVPEALRDKPEDVFLLLASARDLGLAPTIALRKMYVVDSQVTIAPALKMALVRMKGAGRIWKPRPALPDGTFPDPDPPVENTSERAIVYGQRTGEDYVERVEITMDQMREVRYGYQRKYVLVEKDNWKNYPWRMLWWRAVTQLIDDLWPEIGFGLYTPDEIGAMTDEEGVPIDVRSASAPDGFRQAATYAPPDPNAVSPGEEPAPDMEEIQARIDALPPEAQAELKVRWKEKVTFSDGRPIPVRLLTRRSSGIAKALISGIESETRTGRIKTTTTPTPPADVETAVICGACGEEEKSDGSCGCAPDDPEPPVDLTEDLGAPFQ